MNLFLAWVLVFGVFSCGAMHAWAIDEGKLAKALLLFLWAIILGAYAIRAVAP